MNTTLDGNIDPTNETLGLNRREFLNLAWLASLGFVVLDLGVATYLYAMPRFKPGQFGGFFPLGPVSELPPIGVNPVNHSAGRFWLVRTELGILALYKVCTHLGCLYNWEEALGRFRCPCHGSEFEYDGTLFKTPAPRSLDRLVIQIVDPQSGMLLAETDLDTGGPVSLPDNPAALVQVDTSRRIQGKRKT